MLSFSQLVFSFQLTHVYCEGWDSLAYFCKCAPANWSGVLTTEYVPSYFLLGQVYERKGDTRLAIANYRKFLEFWKTADKDLVLLENAKHHLTGLGPSTTPYRVL